MWANLGNVRNVHHSWGCPKALVEDEERISADSAAELSTSSIFNFPLHNISFIYFLISLLTSPNSSKVRASPWKELEASPRRNALCPKYAQKAKMP